MIRIFRTFDYQLLLLAVILASLGIVFIFSATAIGKPNPFWYRQLLWFTVSLTAFFITALIPFKVFEGFSWLMYFVMIGALLFILLFTPSIAGSQRWIDLGAGMRLQPSEFAKFVTIFVTARFLSYPRRDINRILETGRALLIVLPPVVLIFLEPDLGTSFVFFPVLFSMLLWAGLRPLTVILLLAPIISLIASFHLFPFMVFMVFLFFLFYFSRISIGGAVFCFSLNLAMGLITPWVTSKLRPYQLKRIETFINPESDPFNSGYHLIQSKVALGSGGLLGKGFLKGTQINLDFLPASHTDFIFCVLGEQFGFVGCLILLLLFVWLLFRGIRAAQEASNMFISLSAIGVTTLIATQVFVNISMTLGIAPITGLPLPLLSYGGSSMLATMIGLGIIENARIRRHEY